VAVNLQLVTDCGFFTAQLPKKHHTSKSFCLFLQKGKMDPICISVAIWVIAAICIMRV
jgi:hypothetical protein